MERGIRGLRQVLECRSSNQGSRPCCSLLSWHTCLCRPRSCPQRPLGLPRGDRGASITSWSPRRPAGPWLQIFVRECSEGRPSVPLKGLMVSSVLRVWSRGWRGACPWIHDVFTVPSPGQLVLCLPGPPWGLLAPPSRAPLSSSHLCPGPGVLAPARLAHRPSGGFWTGSTHARGGDVSSALRPPAATWKRWSPVGPLEVAPLPQEQPLQPGRPLGFPVSTSWGPEWGEAPPSQDARWAEASCQAHGSTRFCRMLRAGGEPGPRVPWGLGPSRPLKGILVGSLRGSWDRAASQLFLIEAFFSK